MTNQLKAALDALNACPDADAVAQLLRRHGVRAMSSETVGRFSVCPIAIYLKDIGSAKDVRVYPYGSIYADGHWQLGRETVSRFIRSADAGKFPDLEPA